MNGNSPEQNGDQATLKALAKRIADEVKGIDPLLAHQRRKEHSARNVEQLGVKFPHSPQEIHDSGWGVMYALGTPDEVKTALQPLIDRRTPAGNAPRIYPYPGTSAMAFRQSKGEDFGIVDPGRLPYYFLLVGPPGKIPFRFQHDLDIAHAVGRLYFETAAEYEAYVNAVLAYEDAVGVGRQRRLDFFATAHDPLTAQSDKLLAQELTNSFQGRTLTAVDKTEVTYLAERTSGPAATHAALGALFKGEIHKPTLVFTAGHGMRPGPDDEKLAGAIQCQDGALFSGDDLLDEFDVKGLVCFAYACHSAGTPQSGTVGPWQAQLPQRLLRRGALGFLGHVGPAWSYSYSWPGVGKLTTTFDSTLTGMLMGMPIGYAFDEFDKRYLALHHELGEPDEEGNQPLVERFLDGKTTTAGGENLSKEMVRVWNACKDARAYVLFGDPAVCLKPSAMA